MGRLRQRGGDASIQNPADKIPLFPQALHQSHKSFLVLFFKKERSFLKERTKELLQVWFCALAGLEHHPIKRNRLIG
jgi:hypothetical protein